MSASAFAKQPHVCPRNIISPRQPSRDKAPAKREYSAKSTIDSTNAYLQTCEQSAQHPCLQAINPSPMTSGPTRKCHLNDDRRQVESPPLTLSHSANMSDIDPLIHPKCDSSIGNMKTIGLNVILVDIPSPSRSKGIEPGLCINYTSIQTKMVSHAMRSYRVDNHQL
jgi:hypothetical protein